MYYVDECYIAVEKYYAQNERCWGVSFQEIPERKRFGTQSKTTITAMVFDAVWRGAHSKIVVLPSGFRLNQVTYHNDHLTPLLRDLGECFDLENVILYLDKAPCQAARTTQQFLDTFLPQHVSMSHMPADSPDLNPLDNSIRTALKTVLTKH